MFNINKLSKSVPYSDEWYAERIGMMTGSKISCLMLERGIGDGGMTYIRNKVYERITGKTSEKDITTEATVWGVTNEPLAIKYFQEKHQVPLIIVDKHIIFDDLYSVTPDALIIRDLDYVNNESGEYNVETLESKSYMTPSKHMEHCECKTALDIHSINKSLFWQVICQMYFSNASIGNAIFFHPDFSEDSNYRLGHVLFNREELFIYFELFENRLSAARKIYNEKLEFSTKK